MLGMAATVFNDVLPGARRLLKSSIQRAVRTVVRHQISSFLLRRQTVAATGFNCIELVSIETEQG
jgi:hypothetical protein